MQVGGAGFLDCQATVGSRCLAPVAGVPTCVDMSCSDTGEVLISGVPCDPSAPPLASSTKRGINAEYIAICMSPSCAPHAPPILWLRYSDAVVLLCLHNLAYVLQKICQKQA